MQKNNRLKIIGLEEVINITLFRKSSIYKLMDDGDFPKSFKVGCRKTGWLESDILVFVRALAQEKTQDEIKELILTLTANRLEG
jgi:prophage regulatory protein